MPKQKTLQVSRQEPKGFSNSFMVVHDQVLRPWVCEELMSMFDKLPIVEVEETHQSSFMTKDPDMQEQNHRYEHQDRIHGNIYPDTDEFTRIFNLIEFALPKGYEFATVNYVQFIKYPEGSHFPWNFAICASGICLARQADRDVSVRRDSTWPRPFPRLRPQEQ